MTSPITRRAAIVGAIASTAAVGIVGARAANGLSSQQTEAPFDLQHWLDTASPDQVIQHHLEHLTRIIRNEHGGGGWKGFYDRKSGVALVVRDERVDHAYLEIDFIGGVSNG